MPEGKNTTPAYPSVSRRTHQPPKRRVFSGTRKKPGAPEAVRVLGIDPGLAALGYGLIAVVGREMALVTYGTIKTDRVAEDRNEDLRQRCAFVGARLSVLLDAFSPAVDVVAIEAFSWHGKNVTSQIQMANVCGLLREAMRARSVESHEYSARDVKRCLTGNANADKRQVGRMVQSILCLPAVPTPNHAADALAVAVTHALRLPTGNLLPA